MIKDNKILPIIIYKLFKKKTKNKREMQTT